MEQEAIETAVDEWVREVAIDPETGVPDSAGGFEIAGYYTFLIGPMPGANPPRLGTRSHLLDLRFLLTPEETKATIDPLLDRLKAAALKDPELEGRLDARARLELGAASTQNVEPENRRGGPVVVLQARIAELDLGPRPDGADQSE